MVYDALFSEGRGGLLRAVVGVGGGGIVALSCCWLCLVVGVGEVLRSSWWWGRHAKMSAGEA